MKYVTRFIISWFGMAMIEHKIVRHQWIMYTYVLGENNNMRYLLPRENEPLLTQTRHEKDYLSAIIIIKNLKLEENYGNQL